MLNPANGQPPARAAPAMSNPAVPTAAASAGAGARPLNHVACTATTVAVASTPRAAGSHADSSPVFAPLNRCNAHAAASAAPTTAAALLQSCQSGNTPRA